MPHPETTALATAAPVVSPAEAADRAREISAARRLVQASVDVVAQAMVAAWQSRTRPLRSGPLHRV